MKLAYRLVPLSTGVFFQILYQDPRFLSLQVGPHGRGFAQSIVHECSRGAVLSTDRISILGGRGSLRVTLRGFDHPGNLFPFIDMDVEQDSSMLCNDIHNLLKVWSNTFEWDDAEPRYRYEFLEDEEGFPDLYDGTDTSLQGTGFGIDVVDFDHPALAFKLITTETSSCIQFSRCADQLDNTRIYLLGFRVHFSVVPDIESGILYGPGSSRRQRSKMVAANIITSNIDFEQFKRELNEYLSDQTLTFEADSYPQDEQRQLLEDLFKVYTV